MIFFWSNKRKLILILVFLLTACVSPTQKFNQLAKDFGFSQQQVTTDLFKHKIYLNIKSRQSNKIHVYLDGDGTPWERNQWVAYDPTARNPLILRLMTQDNAPAILLGRPCYYGLNHTSECNNQYWTTHRYSKEVVQSMILALKQWLYGKDYDELILIGYSGGGSLAVLMANEIPLVTKVVTVAANLNVTAWIDYHGYKALDQSLNPAIEAKLNHQIKQFHFAGGKDKMVPTFIIEEFSNMQSNANYYLFENHGHACCWEQDWPKILDIFLYSKESR